MHLSMLTDSFVSDSLRDGGDDRPASFGRTHREGLLRGVFFIAALGALVAALCGGLHVHAAAVEASRAMSALAGGA